MFKHKIDNVLFDNHYGPYKAVSPHKRNIHIFNYLKMKKDWVGDTVSGRALA